MVLYKLGVQVPIHNILNFVSIHTNKTKHIILVTRTILLSMYSYYELYKYMTHKNYFNKLKFECSDRRTASTRSYCA